ncbi:MAG TPA: response regulator [Steroidobacteraceae bacterium]|nr:response regulator [Steroidobacteraceae bacterium]
MSRLAAGGKADIRPILPAPAPVEFAVCRARDDTPERELSTVILVVDDDPSVRTSTARLLIAHGHTVFEAASAALAVQRAAEVRPDVILMDLHMPNCTGIEAAREIKQRAELQNTPIIALSATPPDWTLRSALFATVLHKPYLSSQLLEALATAVRR